MYSSGEIKAPLVDITSPSYSNAQSSHISSVIAFNGVTYNAVGRILLVLSRCSSDSGDVRGQNNIPGADWPGHSCHNTPGQRNRDILSNILFVVVFRIRCVFAADQHRVLVRMNSSNHLTPNIRTNITFVLAGDIKCNDVTRLGLPTAWEPFRIVVIDCAVTFGEIGHAGGVDVIGRVTEGDCAMKCTAAGRHRSDVAASTRRS